MYAYKRRQTQYMVLRKKFININTFVGLLDDQLIEKELSPCTVLMPSRCRLNCLCSFPVWCLGQDLQFDCIGVLSLPLPLVYIGCLCLYFYCFALRVLGSIRIIVFSFYFEGINYSS